MENSYWLLENGYWEIVNGKWLMENGYWEIGKQLMVNRLTRYLSCKLELIWRKSKCKWLFEIASKSVI